MIAIVVGLALAFVRLASQQAGAQPAPCYTVPGGVQTLNGTNNYSTNAYTSSMAQPSVTGQISLSAWVCPNQTDTPQMVFKREGAYQLQVNASDDPRFSFTVWTGNGVRSLISDLCLDTLRWQHIAGTYDGSNWRIYHNGRSVGSLSASDGSPAAGSLLPSAPLSPDANTVLLWHLNENSGTNTVDAAAPVLDGANNGKIMPDTILPDYGWTTGRFGGGMNSPSNGTGYVSTTLGTNLFTTQATMDAWIRPTGIALGSSYVMGWNGNGVSFIRLHDADSVGVGFRTTVTTWVEATFDLPKSLLNNWNHIAGTWNDGVIQFYLNGELVGSVNTGHAGEPLLNPTGFIASGSVPWDPAYSPDGRYIGDIDEVRLSNIARTNFTAPPAPPPPAAEFWPDARTVLLWHLNESSGSGVSDVATPVLDGANSGTIVGNDNWTTGKFGSGLNSVSNGTGYVSASLGTNLFSTQAAMEAWIRPTNIAFGGSYVMGWKGPGTEYSYIRLYSGTSAGVGFRVTGAGAYWASADFNLPVNLLNNWNHIAGTFSNGVVRLYLNGALISSHDTGYGAGWTLMQPNAFIAAGGAAWDPPGSGGQRYIGDLDEVRLSTVARTDFTSAPAPASPAAEYSPDARTVALWHLNEGSGSTAADTATPLLDGANTGTVVLNNTWTGGRFGSGLNGATNGTGYLSAVLGPGLFTTRATMDAWIRPTAVANGGSYVMGSKGTNSGYSFIRLYQGGTSAGVGFQVTDGGSVYYAQADFNLPVNLLDGTWRHIAGTFSNGVVNLYLNGALMGSYDTGYGEGWTLSQPTSFLAAGGPPWDVAGSEGSRYIGDIDEVRLSNMARTDFASVAVTPTVSIARSGSDVVVNYTGTLQSATVLTGPFTDVADAASPYTNTPSAVQRYFRSRVP